MTLLSVPGTATSVLVLLTLLVILAASTATFWALVRRWTTHRQWVALADWAREAGLRPMACDPDHLPPPLNALPAGTLMLRLCYGNQGVTVLQARSVLPESAGGDQVTWNLLIRRQNISWAPTGVRPAAAPRSILDLFSLSSFPYFGAQERFVLFGTDSAAARTLANSMTRSLLPPDIGLLLHGRSLLLDFSDRTFDDLELNRMLVLAEQIAGKLPSPP